MADNNNTGNTSSGGAIPPPPAGYSPVTPTTNPSPSIPPPPAGYSPVQGGTASSVGSSDPDWTGSGFAPIPTMQGLKDIGKGFAKGAEGTVAGLDTLANKVGNWVHPGLGDALTTPLVGDNAYHAPTLSGEVTGTNKSRAQTAQDYINLEHQRAQTHNAAQNIGYGGETLTEFMLGDEALKSLSMADKLNVVAKWMKVAEKSPRIMEALKFGATASKTTAELGPEDIALLKQYPKLAKLVSVGLDATRTGAVQGAQTFARTGGDVGQSAEDALGTAATVGVLHGATGAAKSVLGKGSRAARTVEEMGRIAANAPSDATIGDRLTQAVQEGHVPAQNANTATYQTAAVPPLGAQAEAQQAQHLAGQDIQKLAEVAPTDQAITEQAQAAAKAANVDMHARYVARQQQLQDLAKDTTVPFAGSPIHEAVNDLTGEGKASTGPMSKALNNMPPASPKVNQMLSELTGIAADGEKLGVDKWVDVNGVEHTEPAADGEQPQSDLTMQHLLDTYRNLGEKSRNVGWADSSAIADQSVYSRLKKGIIDTVAQLADKSGNPDAIKIAEEMNSDYRNNVRLYDNPKVQAIMQGNLTDVDKTLMGGKNAMGDVNTVKQVLGDKWDDFAQGSLARRAAGFVKPDGTLDYKAFLSDMSRINPDLRQAVYGQNGDSVLNALDTITKASNTAEQANGALTDAEKAYAQRTQDINDSISHIIGDGDINKLIKDPVRRANLLKTVGPEGMKAFTQMMVENWVSKASTTLDKNGMFVKTHFNPDAVLDEFRQFKDDPEAIKDIFQPDPETAAKYQTMMKELQNVSSVKKLVKYGVLPATLGGAGAATTGGWGPLIGAMIGGGTEAGFSNVRDVLDTLANHPRMWSIVKIPGVVAEGIDKAATKATGSPVGRGVIAGAYRAAQDSLSGNTQNKDATKP